MSSEKPQENGTRQLGRGMIYIAWLLVLGLLTLFFSNQLDRQENPNRDLTVTSNNDATLQVVLVQNRAGHYVANGLINGMPVRFLIDTGATNVALPAGVANRLGLKKGRAMTSRTANGDTTTWATRLDSVNLGGLTQYGVRASILPGMAGEEVLLGMSYLKHLELIQQGDQLMLRPAATR